MAGFQVIMYGRFWVFTEGQKARYCAAHWRPRVLPSAQASELMGIKLLDHIVFGKAGFHSFAEAGEL